MLMERRRSARFRVDVPLVAFVDGRCRLFRAIDLSCEGALVQRSGARADRGPPLVHAVELQLGRGVPLRGLARTVWSGRELHAVRFVRLADADRLAIAEHLDALTRRRRG